MKFRNTIVLCLAFFGMQGIVAQERATVSQTWVADQGDGTYKNPVLHADYSDPDAIRVGNDYYITASSFQCTPGLPILHSKDLVNWKLIGHVFDKQPPYDHFDKPQPGGGAWAPSIRFHNGEFYIYYPDPDKGIYMVKAKNPAGPWSNPFLVREAKGWIDPCPLWDDNGRAYLISARASSRAGMKDILVLHEMSADGTRLLGDGVMVFDGSVSHPVVEGPKLYKRNGYYYIFAPAGSVSKGWQLVLRSKNIFGPYEEKITLAQGKTNINGPHQGAWVDTQTGEHWFLHFQDKDAFGRVVHLQPMRWVNDWPVMGNNGEPVLSYKKPNVGAVYPRCTPAESDEFDSQKLGLQWQWMANPKDNVMLLGGHYGFMRLFATPVPEGYRNLMNLPTLLAQKFPAPQFSATTKLTFVSKTEGERVGLTIFGLDYATVAITSKSDGLYVSQLICNNADKGEAETESNAVKLSGNTIYLKATVKEGGACTFSYSENGTEFTTIGQPFTAKVGKWIGAKVGIYAYRKEKTYQNGWADFDWFRMER